MRHSIPYGEAVRKSVPIVLIVAVLAGACSGGSDSAETLASDTTAAPIDFADGAFERVEQPPSDAAPRSSDPATTDPDPVVTEPPTTGSSGSDPTTTNAGQTTDAGSVTSSAPASGSTVTSAAPDNGSSGNTPTESNPPIDPDVEVSSTEEGQGTIVIGDVTYAFGADFCEFASDSVFVEGVGVSTAGQAFIAGVVFQRFDFDNDGVVDVEFDVSVESIPRDDQDFNDLPDFFAAKVDSADFTEGEDLTYSITATRLSGAGPIGDLNGVAAPIDQTLPMTFEVECN